MTVQYDLHAHSTASDGTLSPTELMRRAADAGVRVMALTDHDTLEGIDEARSEAERLGMAFVPGVEISVTWNARTIHIVGLGVDIASDTLQTGLQGLREFRDWRAEEMGRRLAKSGIDGAFSGARAFSNGRLISRTHFARFLVDAGYAKDVRQVFKRYLVSGKPGYVAGDWVPLAEAVGWIHSAGGQAVVAHPARYGLSRTRLRKLFADFVEVGGEAIEVVSGSHSKDEYFTMAQHASDFGLLSSAGSDYHGPDNPWINLGPLPDLPSACLPIWHDWA